MVIETYGDAFPELRARESVIVSTVREEEEAFSTMLERGVKYFNELIEKHDTDPNNQKVRGCARWYVWHQVSRNI